MNTAKLTTVSEDKKTGKMEITRTGKIEKFHNIFLTTIKEGDICEYKTITGNDDDDEEITIHILTKKIPT